jgi:ABC-type branched-subunit amino acid transport system substrate-binding protein
MTRKRIFIGFGALFALGIAALWWYNHGRRATNEIQIGTILGLTGTNSAYGKEMLEGFNFAIEQINGAGGVLGKKLHLVPEDSQFDPGKAVTAYKRLTSVEGIWLIVGVTGSKNALAVCAAAKNDNAVILDPLGSAPKLSWARFPGYFRIMASDAFAGQYNVDWAIDRGMKRPAIVYEEDDWGASYRDAVVRYLAQKGFKATPSYGVTEGMRDFKTMVQKLRLDKPDALFLLTYAGEAAPFMRDLRQLGLGTAVYGSDNISSGEFATAGAAAIEGARVAMPMPANGSQYDAFVARYRQKTGKAPDANILKSYDAMSLMAKAIAGNGPDPQRIRAYFNSPNFSYEGVSGRIRFDANGDLVGQQYSPMVYQSSQLVPSK